MPNTKAMLLQVMRANALRHPSRPREFCLHTTAGEDIPSWIRGLIREQDKVFIRHFNAYVSPEDEPGASWGWFTTAAGRTAILYRDGRIEWAQ